MRLTTAVVCIVGGVSLAATGVLQQPVPREGAPSGAPPTVRETDATTPWPRAVGVATPRTGYASRLVISDLGIDLPVVSGQLSEVPENPDAFPLCDVAQYLAPYVQPGQVGTTYLFGHARRGMLRPLLEASKVRNGEQLVGARVLVYTSDARLHIYEIFAVKRHATDFALADDIAAGEHRLIVHTSEGPRGTLPKLQIAARPVEVVPAPISEAVPSAAPRICR